MWYDSCMPEELPENILEAAQSAVAYAQQVRRFHRRRTNRNTTQRATDMELALTRLREAMAPLRSEIGRFPYGPQTPIAAKNRDAIRAASDSIQVERRKLHKMKPTTVRSAA